MDFNLHLSPSELNTLAGLLLLAMVFIVGRIVRIIRKIASNNAKIASNNAKIAEIERQYPSLKGR